MWGGELTDPLERTLGKPWTLFLEEKHTHTKILTLKPVHVPLCRPHMQQINLIFCALSQNSVKWKKVRVLGRWSECDIQKGTLIFSSKLAVYWKKKNPLHQLFPAAENVWISFQSSSMGKLIGSSGWYFQQKHYALTPPWLTPQILSELNLGQMTIWSL